MIFLIYFFKLASAVRRLKTRQLAEAGLAENNRLLAAAKNKKKYRRPASAARRLRCIVQSNLSLCLQFGPHTKSEHT